MQSDDGEIPREYGKKNLVLIQTVNLVSGSEESDSSDAEVNINAGSDMQYGTSIKVGTE
jgi:hypothetical protein